MLIYGAPDDFNPRSPYGERRLAKIEKTPEPIFQSTLPLRGATYNRLKELADQQFQSTLPLRGATMTARATIDRLMISIHAPLTGSDSYKYAKIYDVWEFQSTLPLRGATC